MNIYCNVTILRESLRKKIILPFFVQNVQAFIGADKILL